MALSSGIEHYQWAIANWFAGSLTFSPAEQLAMASW
jgi:hypothetical protein